MNSNLRSFMVLAQNLPFTYEGLREGLSPQIPDRDLLTVQLGSTEHAIFSQSRITNVECGSDGSRVFV